MTAKADSQVKSPEKRKLPAVESNSTPAKKVSLNRKNIIEEIKEDVAKKEETINNEKKVEETSEADKKVVKLSEITTTDVIPPNLNFTIFFFYL